MTPFTAHGVNAIATPLVDALTIAPPRFHLIQRFAQLRCPEYARTTIINNKPHVFINPARARTLPLMLATIAHELIHCWQFTNRYFYIMNRNMFLAAPCEKQAYRLEQLATVALAVAYLQQREGKDNAIAAD